MAALAALVAGFAVALAAYYLQSAVLARAPAFDQGTVTRFGLFTAALLFAFSGPVMLLRALAKAVRTDPNGRVGPVHVAVFALSPLWAGMIGIAVIGTARLVAGS